MESADTDRASMANRKAFNDVHNQLNCLKKLCDELGNKSESCQTELKALLRSQYPQYLPPPDSCLVVIRFDSKDEPHFEFHLYPKLLPNGWPDYEGDKDVAFYSTKIYNILKKDIDREAGAADGMVGEGGSNGVNDSGITSPSNENTEEENGEAYQWTTVNAFGYNLPTSLLEHSIVEGKDGMAQMEASSTNIPTSSNDSRPVNVSIKQETSDSNAIFQPNVTTTTKRKHRVTNFFLSKRPRQGEAGEPNQSRPNDDWSEADRLYYQAVPATEGSDRLVCPICSKVYTSNYLKEHINTVHYCKKPFYCTWRECKYETKYRKNAYDHVRKHHLVPGNLSHIDEKLFVGLIEYID